MPPRHSSPPAAADAAQEKLKRPKRKAVTTRHLESSPDTSQGVITPLTAPPDVTPLEELAGTPHTLPQTQANSSALPAPAEAENPTKSKEGIITVGGIDFHHESEAEFASLLNYYGIEWQYEPHQFALQWRDGRPTEMFTPDFYLTEYDLYIELTTMRQSLVRRKNRKLRLLRALYPEINIKLIYRRDYQRILERFGIHPEEFSAEQPSHEEITGF